MQNMACSGSGKFALGLFSGMVAGAALGMTMAPSERRLKRAAHQMTKKVNQMVDGLAEAMDL